MQQKIVAPQVDDEGNGRFELCDIRKVLVGADANVGAAGDVGAAQRGDHAQVRPLVGNEIVGVEIAGALGQLRDMGRERVERLDTTGVGGARQDEAARRRAEEQPSQRRDGHPRIIRGAGRRVRQIEPAHRTDRTPGDIRPIGCPGDL